MNFDINQLFRYLLSGGWTLACYFFIRPDEIEKIGKNGVNLLILALVIGSIIYVVYRALFYPVWYKVLYRLLFWLKIIPKKDPGFKYIFFPSKIEIEDNFLRWARRYNEKSFSSKNIILWGSQVHLLFSSAFGGLFTIFYTHIVADPLGNRTRWVIISTIILFLAALINSTSLVMHDIKAKEMETFFSEQADNKTK